MRPDEILEHNLRALLTRAYVPIRPSSAFRARLLRELAPRPRIQVGRLAAAALLITVLGFALRQVLAPPRIAPGSRLRQDEQAWRPLSSGEAQHGVEYGAGTLELQVVQGRHETVWLGAHGSIGLDASAEVRVRAGASEPSIEVLAGRARLDRVEAGPAWRVTAAGVSFELASGTLRLEQRPLELLACLESGTGTFGDAREPLPAQRELVFRDGALVERPSALEAPGSSGARKAFPTGANPVAEPALPPGAPALRLAGRLLGQAGAPWTAEFTLVALRDERLPDVARPIVRQFQDAQGAFDFALARSGRYTLFALADGQATLRLAGLEPQLQPKALELRLESGVALRGRVLEAGTGRPISGVTIVSEDDAPAQILSFDPAELPGQLSARATSDAEGRFVLERLSSGLHTLRATAPGHGAAWSPRIDTRSAPTDVELVLGPGGTIEAVLEPPRAGLQLVASAIDFSFQRPCLSFALAVTDVHGQARFEHLPPGPFVVLRVDALASTDVSYAFVREGATSEVHLGPAPRDHVLAGRVLDPDGAPVAGADLMLQSDDAEDERWRSTRTDASGRFQFEGVPSGLYSLYAGDLGRNFHEVDHPRVEALDVVREIVLPRGEISGRVEAGGRALPQAWLVLQSRSGEGWRFMGKTQADEQGRWRFAELARGSWRVVAYAQNERLAPAASATLELGQDGAPLETAIALGPGAALELLVRDASGTPCGGASLELFDAHGERWQFSPADRTDAAGRFAVPGMPPGAWSVRIRKAGSANAERSFQLEADQLSTLEITLETR